MPRHVLASERNRIFGAYFSCVMMIFVVVLGDSGRYQDFSLTLWRKFLFIVSKSFEKDMEISLIVNIAFLVAIALVLSMMLRWDLQMLQQHSFSTADYYDWLRSTDETCSTKRIVMLAVLIGSTTTYAKESWLVMALLATVTLALATFLLKQQRKQPLHFSKRMAINSFTTLLIACIFTTIVAIMSETPELKMLNSVYSVLFFATFSYVFSLIANWLVGLFIKKDAK